MELRPIGDKLPNRLVRGSEISKSEAFKTSVKPEDPSRKIPSITYKLSVNTSQDPIQELRFFSPRKTEEVVALRTFQVNQPNINDHFILTKDMIRHVSLITRPEDTYIAVGSPDDNSGFYLEMPDDLPKGIKQVRPLEGSDLRGVSVTLELSKSEKLELRNLIMESIRTIRDWRKDRKLDTMKGLFEVAGFRARENLAEKLKKAFPEELGGDISYTYDPERRALEITRSTWDKRNHFKIRLYPVSDPNLEDISALKIGKIEAKPLSKEITIEFLSDHKPVKPLFRERLLNDKFKDWARNLRDPKVRSYIDEMVNALEFLTTQEKFLAGSWRYLTYFGRDTMFTSLALQPVLSKEAMKVALQSVLNRLNDKGEVAHEENIGEQALYERGREILELKEKNRLSEARKLLKDILKPVYDYKMIDDDYILPLLTRDVLKNHLPSKSEKIQFLREKNDRGETNLESILRNLNLAIAKALPYAQTGDPKDMIRLKGDLPVGDWRDSIKGLAYGKYPLSVNVGLVPSSLKAIRELISELRGLIGEVELKETAERLGLRDLKGVLENPQELDKIISQWENSYKSFKVKLSPDQVRERVKRYLKRFPEEERRYFLSQEIDGVTIEEFLEGKKTPKSLRDGIEFLALSLDESGRPIPVMNTDIGFLLFNEVLPPKRLAEILKVIELPYPIGLYTPVGTLCSSPALSGDEKLHEALNKEAYHGTVVWPWQDVYITLGLIKQYRYYKSKADRLSRDHAKLLPRIKRDIEMELNRIKRLREKYGDFINNELWNYQVEEENGKLTMKPIPHAGKNVDTESNTVQLWSTAWLSALEEGSKL